MFMYRNSIKEPMHNDSNSSGSSMPRRDSLSLLLNDAIINKASQEGRVSLLILIDCFIFDIAPVCVK